MLKYPLDDRFLHFLYQYSVFCTLVQRSAIHRVHTTSCFAIHNSEIHLYLGNTPVTPDYICYVQNTSLARNQPPFNYRPKHTSAYFGYRFHPLPFPLILHSRMSSGIFSIALILFCNVTPILLSHLWPLTFSPSPVPLTPAPAAPLSSKRACLKALDFREGGRSGSTP